MLNQTEMEAKDNHLTSVNPSLIDDAVSIIEHAHSSVYRSINTILVRHNWLLGKRISEETSVGGGSESYGDRIIANLSSYLTSEYGKGFDRSSLYKYVRFYRLFPKIVDSLSPQSDIQLSWTHYRILLQVDDDRARKWYEQEAASQVWSVRTLQRNISTDYYHRLLLTQKKDLVENEMKEKTERLQDDKLEFIKNPVVAEFLGLSSNTDFTETSLERSIINHMERFLLELGKGFAFVARQKHIHSEKEDYFIDLVFYNYLLKCFFLVDLKVSKLRHQDVGQMDMYVRMYDELVRCPDDNPTIGLLLCADTDEDIARYSVLKGNEQVFAAKYLPYLPSPKELEREIERQKTFFYMSQSENGIPS